MLKAHEADWMRFEASGKTEILYSDVPWPDARATPNALIALAIQQASDMKATLRKLQVRWHPDKWSQRYASRLYETHEARVMERVKDIAQFVNTLKLPR